MKNQEFAKKLVKQFLEKDSDGTYTTLKDLICSCKETAGIFIFAILSLETSCFEAVISKLPEILARFSPPSETGPFCKASANLANLKALGFGKMS